MNVAVEERTPATDGARAPEESGRAQPGTPPAGPVRPSIEPVLLAAAAAALSGAAAAWMVAGLFRGLMPRFVGLLGVAIGTVLVASSYRARRGALLQYAVVPAAAITGTLIVAPAARGGTANLPSLVVEAIRGGGLLTPPVPFDPGWRFLLVVFFAALCATGLTLALRFGKPRLGVILPLPVTFGAALLQPRGAEVGGSTVATFLVVAALGAAYGADLASTGAASLRFEARRMAKGAILLSVAMLGMVMLARTDALFPATQRDRILPPRRPPVVPLDKDRIVFTVADRSPGPWRTGTLDVYDGTGWLLPPVDTGRVRPMKAGVVPGGKAAGARRSVTMRIADIRGHALPVPAGLVRIAGPDEHVSWDPRTQVPELDARVPQGFTYTATYAALPGAKQLASITAPDPPTLDAFGFVPPPPPRIARLMAAAPAGLFDRIQFLRDRLYQNVVAAGGGSPVDVPPARVEAMLQKGAEATPFEITAAEALLARWASLPSRIGYGYYGGEKTAEGFAIHPKHGAAWLEVHFPGLGWVPLVGTPPRAKSSPSDTQKNDNPAVTATEELALTVIIPVQRHGVRQLFEIVRYWLLVASPFLLGALAFALAYAPARKHLRASRRRRWAEVQGPVARAFTAYAEFRDRCHDLNIGEITDTPLAFRHHFEHDDEHDELAWLITRILWGDLRRDARPEDAEAAERATSSLTRRLLTEQPAVNRALGALSRASLANPYSDEIPNVRRRRPVLGVARRQVWRALRRMRHRAAVTAALLLLSACAPGPLGGARVPVAYPDRIAPSPPRTLGGFEFVREPRADATYRAAGPDRLVSEGRVFTVRKDDVVHASLQVSLFKRRIDSTDPAVRREVEQAIGGAFSTVRIGTVHLRRRQGIEQRMWLWFPPERNAMVVLIARREFVAADELARALVFYMRGIDPAVTGVAEGGAA